MEKSHLLKEKKNEEGKIHFRNRTNCWDTTPKEHTATTIEKGRGVAQHQGLKER